MADVYDTPDVIGQTDLFTFVDNIKPDRKPEDLVKELAGFEPLRVVFRDNGFVSDSVNINVEQLFKQLSPGAGVKSI